MTMAKIDYCPECDNGEVEDRKGNRTICKRCHGKGTILGAENGEEENTETNSETI